MARGMLGQWRRRHFAATVTGRRAPRLSKWQEGRSGAEQPTYSFRGDCARLGAVEMASNLARQATMSSKSAGGGPGARFRL